MLYFGGIIFISKHESYQTKIEIDYFLHLFSCVNQKWLICRYHFVMKEYHIKLSLNKRSILSIFQLNI